MHNDKYKQALDALNEEISQSCDVWELYYRRGYLYFLLNDEQKAKEDYRYAVKIGLDPIENPYYAFSASNELRRDFSVPEKILVMLILVIIGFALTIQIAGFILKIKGLIG